jgi:hypothetical protein
MTTGLGRAYMFERGRYPDVCSPEACAMDGIEMEEAIAVSIDEEDISIALTATTPKDCTDASGHTVCSPIVGGAVIDLITEVPDVSIYLQVTGERIPKPRPKRQYDWPKRRAGAAMVAAKSACLHFGRTGRLVVLASFSSLETYEQ